MKFIFMHLNKIVAGVFILGAVYSVALIAGAGWSSTSRQTKSP